VWYDAGLIASVAIGGWMALDVAMAEDWRRRSITLGLLGAFGALWAAAELLLRVADTPAEFAGGRRLLYLGTAGATFCWYWVAVEADSPRWFRDGRWRIGIAALPLVVIHSLLYWGPDGLVIELTAPEPSHGPLWYVAACISWSMICAGLFHYGRAAIRLRRKNQLRMLALAMGIGIPLVLNIAYGVGAIGWDPAPCLLGPAALMIRLGVIDTGLALFLPLARSDIIEQLDVGVVVAGIDDGVIDSNFAAARLFGVPDPRGQRLEELIALLPTGIEVLRFPLQSHFSHTGTAVVLSDRREAVEAERRLQLAGRLEAVGSLTAGIAHEVNNPLAYISANLNTLEKLVTELNRSPARDRLPDELQRMLFDGAESLTDVQEGFERISLLVTRLKGFARRPQTADSERSVGLFEVAERAASLVGVGLSADAVSIRNSDTERVEVNDEAVLQVLVNLMLNAVQASGESPRVDVDIRRDGDEAVVAVADRGHGISEESMAHIFDPFFTTRRAGSGLGLSISFDLARRLGGRIEAANRPGGGAVFSLHLPVT